MSMQRRRLAALVTAVAALAFVAVSAPVAASRPGTSWVVSEPPQPPQATGGLYTGLGQVSCSAARACGAIGYYATSSAPYLIPLIEVLGQDGWTPYAVPLPSDASMTFGGASLVSVVCPSSAFCVAVGQYSRVDGPNQGLIAMVSGGVATSMSAPPVESGTNPSGMVSVSCASSSLCVAVSDTQVIETFTNGTWSPSLAPLPSPNLTFAELNEVSCTGVGRCVAVGEGVSTTSPSSDTGVLETLSNGVWGSQVATLPPDAMTGFNGDFRSLDCLTSGFCIAVGDYSTDNNGDQGLIATVTNGVWQAMEAPLPNTNDSGFLTSVSCPDSQDGCVAIGFVTMPNIGTYREIIDSQARGGTWSSMVAPVPAGTGQTEVAFGSGVSCTRVFCAVVGDIGAFGIGGPGFSGGFVDTDFNGSWTSQAVAQPSDGGETFLSSIACGNEVDCITTGNYRDPSRVTHLLALASKS